jgi:hypothetical protein
MKTKNMRELQKYWAKEAAKKAKGPKQKPKAVAGGEKKSAND